MSEPSTNPLKRPGPPVTDMRRRATKKSKFKTIETPDVPANAMPREIDRLSVTTSDKGNFMFSSQRRKIFLTPDDLFADSALETISQETIETIMQGLPDREPEEREESEVSKKQRQRADLRASVRDWLPMRARTLDELLLYEGTPSNYTEGSLCHGCAKKAAAIRCMECDGRALYCPDCVVAQHQRLPLHRLEAWQGTTFARTSLCAQGLSVQLGHEGTAACPNPASKTRNLVVVDVTGIHEVTVRFCECICSSTRKYTPEWIQVIRRGWFPATNNRPATAFTFRVLKTFHEMNFQSKMSLYDYWRSLERITDNTGTEPPLRARAHDPAGISATQPGSLAVECPACPHPDKNLPDGWESAPEEQRWLYTMYLMLDANFRAKCKAQGLDPFELGPGWSYFVEESDYQAHLKRCGAQKEENKCSAEHNAIINANVKRDGYVASGVGAVLCARHALVRKNGVGDTQQGEKYANMDYLFFSTLLGVIIIILLVSYDIACQWSINLVKRMADFPIDMWLDLSRTTLRYAIPKKHFRVHGPNHSRFSFNFLRGVGRTYGEGIESHWSHMNPVALSAREMSPGVRHEHLNDHWGAWNWQKIVGFGLHFLRSLHEARTMHVKQKRAFEEYSSTFDSSILAQWADRIKTWEADTRKPDPYEEPMTKISQNAIRRQLAEEEAAEKANGALPVHETTPSIFLQVGLELEEQQRVLRMIKVSPNSDKSAAELQEKQTLVKRRITLWQAIQDVHMPQVAALRAGALPEAPSSASSNDLRSSSKAEDIELFLPSALPPSLRQLESLGSLCDKERPLRLAQLSDCLEDIRRLRRVLTGITQFKRLNVSNTGQRANTRIRALYARFEAKISRAVLRYRDARIAMDTLHPAGEWAQQYKELRDEDVSGPGREDDTSEGRHELSWIWLVSAKSATGNSAADFAESMRVEWSRFRARVERWEEEEQLLLEEMRRILEFFKHRATWWRDQAGRRSDISPELARALAIYAEKQALVMDRLRTHFVALWVPYLESAGPLPPWAVQHAGLKARGRRAKVWQQRALQLVDDLSSSSDSESELASGSGSDLDSESDSGSM
ncbi:hypothetical protein OH76DRAFT_1459514 [Lentinus brumalis]|uniref:CxC2-like cysteine cluster KDZ transposase-associated domain-containing protein n=1 Tax=Lentinus brumalis TaxID=2498619 RepID=A0A371CJH5_9APHY|nr:hypothetical protein OH76DRAFT_1459514 [Polyporus brumalis]